MIEYEDDRTFSRYVFKAHYFNVPKIDAHRKSEHGNNESASHGDDYCTRFWFAMVPMFLGLSPCHLGVLCVSVVILIYGSLPQRRREHRGGPEKRSSYYSLSPPATARFVVVQ